jgi:hypothetical protein
VLIKREMRLFLLSLLKYSEMLSQMITFNHFSSNLSYFSRYIQIELEGNLLDQNLNELENELSRI